jgi:outer membrane protein assembly factor BamE (lipoprotein component of BamABCDE complex)
MKKPLMVLLAMVVLSGCAIYNEAVRYNKLPHEQTQGQLVRISENYAALKIGMTEKEVVGLIGEPQLKMAVLFTTQIQWVYTSHSQMVHLLWGPGKFIELYFRDGKLIRFPSRGTGRIKIERREGMSTSPEKPITSAPTTFSSGTTKILTWDFSVVKSGPGSNYSSIATVRKGDKLTIMEQSVEWVKVRLENGQEGWIRGEVFE